ncbi:protein argonaute 4-like [Rhododendron vialii]|uniref:protein argonaute 4-like n=1 Tax=Rhododendron vialii TaxID=182163 RepID=UPI00265E06D6|nr:protein argonaute 4-like [Rhododendron vialii]
MSQTLMVTSSLTVLHFFYEDGRPVDGKGIGRKVLDRVHENYDTELAGKDFAYDVEKSLFTLGPLPRNKLEFTNVLEDVVSNRNNGNRSPGSPNDGRKRQRRQYNSKTFKVEISFAAKIPMQSNCQCTSGSRNRELSRSPESCGHHFETTCIEAGLPPCSPVIF